LYSWVKLSHIAHWSGGQFVVPPSVDISISDLSTDTRSVKPGDLFVALRGERFDAHDYLTEAVDKGAAALIVERPVAANVPVIVVEDSLKALVCIAEKIREFFTGPVFAVTGSAGKSSTKDAIATLLGENTVASPASYNNLLGVSKTLCLVNSNTKHLVLEMGMNALGEIAEMCVHFRPKIGMITNIGDAHIGHLGGRENIFRAKKEMFDFLGANAETEGVAINSDDALVERAAQEALPPEVKKIRFSVRGKATDVSVKNVRMDPNTGFLLMTLTVGPRTESVELPVFGLHHAHNVAAAVACVQLRPDLHIDPFERLTAIRPAPHRGEIHRLTDDRILIDECYNSNPTALSSSLTSLKNLTPQRRRVLVLGEMRELGDYTERLHRQVGETIASTTAASPLLLIAVGNDAASFIDGLKVHRSDALCYQVSSCDKAIEILNQFPLQPSDLCLVKGSRGVKLEGVVHFLQKNYGLPAAPAKAQ